MHISYISFACCIVHGGFVFLCDSSVHNCSLLVDQLGVWFALNVTREGMPSRLGRQCGDYFWGYKCTFYFEVWDNDIQSNCFKNEITVYVISAYYLYGLVENVHT